MQVVNRYSSKGKKDWIKGVFLIIAWVLIISLARDLWQIKNGFSRIEESKTRLAEEEKKNTELKEKLDMVSTEEYREKIIREQLNMQKIGEVVAVVPKKEDIANTTEEDSKEKKVENWEKWWGLLK